MQKTPRRWIILVPVLIQRVQACPLGQTVCHKIWFGTRYSFLFALEHFGSKPRKNILVFPCCMVVSLCTIHQESWLKNVRVKITLWHFRELRTWWLLTEVGSKPESGGTVIKEL